MGSEIWGKLNQKLPLLQRSLHLPTLLDNLVRKGQIDQQTNKDLLNLEVEEAVPKLLDLLMSRNPSSARDMSDALQETHPDIAEKVGLGSLPGT